VTAARRVLGFSLAAAVLVGAIVYLARTSHATFPAPGGNRGATAPDSASVDRAFQGRRSDVPVEGRGKVVRILADDKAGSRHQRFIVRLDSGTTVLVAHAIDVAGRVSPLEVGDEVSFRGEYVWNPKGGLVHWTHRDPVGRHAGGWIRRGERTFE
jgi:uncharacterized protein DUF3465